MSEIEAIALKLRTTIRFLHRHADAIRDPGSPARSEQSVLVWLDERGPMSPKALADAQKVRPQTVAQTLDSLARHKWIRRGPHPHDRRQILISLSPSGKKALEKGRSQRQAWMVGELKKLTAPERKTLSAALEIIERFVSDDFPNPSQS
jgi:DNA-binding MarR family transcriptional regulator